MEAQFTKGKWYPIQYGPYWHIQTEPFYEDKVDLLNEEDFGEHAQANALLASKSPELLSSLNSAIKHLKYIDWPDNMQETLFNFCANAEQLITDATTI